jgi:predicted LPLAT superfamily acyltransferase
MALNEKSAPRNPGPSWGYGFLRASDRVLPRAVFDVLLRAGTWIAVAAMPAQRGHSRAYLEQILGRPPTRREVWRHFYAFTEMFMLRLRVADGRAHVCRTLPCGDEFRALMQSGRPALLGTFHFGNSDLLGFLLRDLRRRVFMIRLRMENSPDTRRLAEQFGDWVTFIWVNATDDLLFALKEAAQSEHALAMKCDRPEHSGKLEAFEFLGAPRLFPFTIYHLSLLFRRPVVHCVSVPGGPDESIIHSSPVFEPDDASKESNLARARVHFQEFLSRVETLLRAQPFLWFNFTPLNPVARVERRTPLGVS